MCKERLLDVLILVIQLFLVPEECQGERDGWVTTPGTVRVCEGGTASLKWVYNETLGTPRGVNVARSDKVITLVSKLGTKPPTSHLPRATFLDNAGVIIDHVTLDDAGKYKSTVVFSAEKSLLDETDLAVYDSCPNRREFENPDIDVTYALPSNQDAVDLQSALGDALIRVSVKVPAGQPEVNCTLTVNSHTFDCESGNATIPVGIEDNAKVTVMLFHEARGHSNKTVIISIGQEDAATSPTTYLDLSGAGSSSTLSVVLGAMVLVLGIAVALFTYNQLHKKKCREFLSNKWAIATRRTATREEPVPAQGDVSLTTRIPLITTPEPSQTPGALPLRTGDTPREPTAQVGNATEDHNKTENKCHGSPPARPPPPQRTPKPTRKDLDQNQHSRQASREDSEPKVRDTTVATVLNQESGIVNVGATIQIS